MTESPARKIKGPLNSSSKTKKKKASLKKKKSSTRKEGRGKKNKKLMTYQNMETWKVVVQLECDRQGDGPEPTVASLLER